MKRKKRTASSTDKHDFLWVDAQGFMIFFRRNNQVLGVFNRIDWAALMEGADSRFCRDTNAIEFGKVQALRGKLGGCSCVPESAVKEDDKCRRFLGLMIRREKNVSMQWSVVSLFVAIRCGVFEEFAVAGRAKCGQLNQCTHELVVYQEPPSALIKLTVTARR